MNVLKEIKGLGIKLRNIDALHIFVNGTEVKYDSQEDSIDELTNNLSGIEYDNGFGVQELFGLILMKDHSWFERSEYDGAEGWDRKVQITKDDVFNFKEEKEYE